MVAATSVAGFSKTRNNDFTLYSLLVFVTKRV